MVDQKSWQRWTEFDEFCATLEFAHVRQLLTCMRERRTPVNHLLGLAFVWASRSEATGPQFLQLLGDIPLTALGKWARAQYLLTRLADHPLLVDQDCRFLLARIAIADTLETKVPGDTRPPFLESDFPYAPLSPFPRSLSDNTVTSRANRDPSRTFGTIHAHHATQCSGWLFPRHGLDTIHDFRCRQLPSGTNLRCPSIADSCVSACISMPTLPPSGSDAMGPRPRAGIRDHGNIFPAT